MCLCVGGGGVSRTFCSIRTAVTDRKSLCLDRRDKAQDTDLIGSGLNPVSGSNLPFSSTASSLLSHLTQSTAAG